MNDKDKEAFEKWFNEERRSFESSEPATYTDSDEWLMEKGWQSACEYKDKSLINGTRMKQMNEEIERLKAENQVLSVNVVLLENKVRQYQSIILELQERTILGGK